jgi:hypothetical protein
MTETTNQAAFRRALAGLPQFVYGNGLQLVVLSVAWVVCSLPLVTMGPATLMVYTAIQDLRSGRNTIDRSRIISILRQNGAASIIFSGVPFVFGIIAFLYGTQALQQGVLLGEIVALITGYVALYATLVLIPTFNAMAAGVSPMSSVRRGVRWVRAYPTAALTTALLTVIILALSVLLTIAFVLLFAGIVVSLHVAVVDEFDSQNLEDTPTATVTVT